MSTVVATGLVVLAVIVLATLVASYSRPRRRPDDCPGWWRDACQGRHTARRARHRRQR